MNLREAAEQVLEAFSWNESLHEPMKSLNQALTQPNWRGLTDEEKQYFKGCGLVGVDIIEAKLRERNG